MGMAQRQSKCCTSARGARRAQSLWHNLDHLKTRLRHLFQYLNTTKTFGLLYTFPQKEQPSTLSEFTVFADSSFAPSGKHSQTGHVILLSCGNVRHLIHWHSTREKKVAESSAESEIYALCTSFKTARNFRLLQSRKCAINTFWTKNLRGLLGVKVKGVTSDRQIIYARISPIFEVFSGPPTGLT